MVDRRSGQGEQEPDSQFLSITGYTQGGVYGTVIQQTRLLIETAQHNLSTDV